MAYVKVWIHAVWGTKNRLPILTPETRPILFQHIKNNAVDKSFYIDFVNGYTDHVHCLFALNADMTIAKTLQLIKGESSFWANNQKLVEPKLEWADEYFAVSVSESMIDTVRNYIKNQEEHHKKITFQQEYNSFITKYNFSSQR
ncbi:MAG: IS200/IS605 family transposase [Flavipsychrobacter sp.]|nr:IS200/IS605 family transposase [Flavipsychrobacter sp.]